MEINQNQANMDPRLRHYQSHVALANKSSPLMPPPPNPPPRPLKVEYAASSSVQHDLAAKQKSLDYVIIDRKVLKNQQDDFKSLDFVSKQSVLIYSIPSHICVVKFYEGFMDKYRIRCSDGCESAKVLPNHDSLLYTNSQDFKVTMMDWNEKKKVRNFRGHTARINTMSINENFFYPLFLTSSDDGLVKFWDGRAKNSVAHIEHPSPPLAAFHPNGTQFAVGVYSNALSIHDIRDKGLSIHRFKIEPEAGVVWKRLKYSADGKLILVTTNSKIIHLFDGENAALLKSFEVKNSIGEELGVEFSRCGKFLLCGSSDAKLHVIDIASGNTECIYELVSESKANVKFISLSTTNQLFATAGDGEINYWSETGHHK